MNTTPASRSLSGFLWPIGIFLLTSLPAVAAADPATTWPDLYGQAGSDEVQNPDEVTEMAGLGLHLVVKPEFQTRGDLGKTMRQHGVKYIDSSLWNQLFWTKLCSSATQHCTQDPQIEQTALDSIAHHLDGLSKRTDIVGYWILDDYPGSDIHGTLEKVHTLVQQANEKANVKRPTICGIGAPIYVDKPHSPGKTAFEQAYPYVIQTLSNFSPKACDVIAVYSYMYAHQRDFSPDKADWTMQSLLPGLFDELRARGWTPEAIPIIGMPQVFYKTPVPGDNEFTVVPRPGDIAAQTEAFCKAGAIAILAFSWDDGNQGRSEPFNTPTLKQGLVDGVHRCQAIWGGKS